MKNHLIALVAVNCWFDITKVAQILTKLFPKTVIVKPFGLALYIPSPLETPDFLCRISETLKIVGSREACILHYQLCDTLVKTWAYTILRRYKELYADKETVITVAFVSPTLPQEGGGCGYVTEIDVENKENGKKFTFKLIVVRRTEEEKTVKILAHEMYHVIVPSGEHCVDPSCLMQKVGYKGEKFCGKHKKKLYHILSRERGAMGD